MARHGRKLSTILVVGVPPLLALLAVVVTTQTAWLRSDEEPNVTVYVGDVLVARATPSGALDILEEYLGFRPAVPRNLPLDGMTMERAYVLLSRPGADDEPMSWIVYSIPGGPVEDVVLLSQTTEPRFHFVEREEDVGRVYGEAVRRLTIGLGETRAWAHMVENSLGGVYLLNVDGMWIEMISGPPLSDREAIAMLRSLASRAR